jgi:hypothetical protein
MNYDRQRVITVSIPGKGPVVLGGFPVPETPEEEAALQELINERITELLPEGMTMDDVDLVPVTYAPATGPRVSEAQQRYVLSQLEDTKAKLEIIATTVRSMHTHHACMGNMVALIKLQAEFADMGEPTNRAVTMLNSIMTDFINAATEKKQ